MIDTSLYKEKPRELCIESTTSCNCKCDFCYNQNSFAKNGRDDNGLSTAELKKIIDIVSDAGIERIRFTGGEPLLQKDILTLLKKLVELGYNVNIETNGSINIKPFQLKNVIITMDYKTKSSLMMNHMNLEYIKDYSTQRILGILRHEANGDIYAIDFESQNILGVYKASQNITIEYTSQRIVSKGNSVVSFIYQRQSQRR